MGGDFFTLQIPFDSCNYCVPYICLVFFLDSPYWSGWKACFGAFFLELVVFEVVYTGEVECASLYFVVEGLAHGAEVYEWFCASFSFF